jgi:hypothetical protein
MDVAGDAKQPCPIAGFEPESVGADERTYKGVLGEIGGVRRLSSHSSEIGEHSRLVLP